MYWQKRFDRESPDKDIDERIKQICKDNKNYGYRRVLGELRKQGILINKKKVQRIMQKFNLQVTLYLDPFMDMCNGEILSYSIDKHPSAMNIMNALNKAIKVTSDCPYRRTFHSDQGWAYQMKSYSHRLKEERIFQSMSRKGNCYDNFLFNGKFLWIAKTRNVLWYNLL